MKKIYFFLLLALPFLNASAQCTFDYAWLALGKNGVWPDSATNFVSGTVGQPYTQNITVKVPYDTTAVIFGSSQNVHFDHIDLQTNISNPPNYGLPPGLTLTGMPSNFKFPGNDTSCMLISGTPTTAGTYSMSFTLKTYVTEFPGIAVNTQTITYYFITIAPATGIQSYASQAFGVSQNTPNPVKDRASIRFVAAAEGKAKFTVFNVAGQKLFEKEMNAARGDNSIDFDASDLENGVYLYSVEMNQQKQSRRMVVAR
jgi:hypothetical protein